MTTRSTFLGTMMVVLAIGGFGFRTASYAQAASTPKNPAVAPASASPSVASTDDIRDIRGPKAISSQEAWILWALGGIALVAAIYGGWRWYRHVKTTPRLPYEIALDRLEKARALMKVELAREFSIEVSEIVRCYIEARFHIRATHQTTEEFLHDLLEPSDSLLVGHQQLLGDFLHHCDLAKFARWVLSVEEMEEMHGSARVFVTETGKASAPVSVTPLPQNQPIHA